jgi:hypothetical protein
MQGFSIGNRVRVDIPDETDPDHGAYHGVHGRVVAVLSDDVNSVTDDVQDSCIYRVILDMREEVDFRRHDLRPPFGE